MAHSTKSSESSLTFSASASEPPMEEESKSTAETAESVSSDRSLSNLSSDLNAPRTMLFLGARDCGKHELVELLVEHLQKQGYDSPAFHKLFKNRVGDVYHFKEEGLRIVEFPCFDPSNQKFKAESVSDRFKTPFTRDVPRVDAIFLVVKAVDTKINVIRSMRFFNELFKTLFGRDSSLLGRNIFILFPQLDDGTKNASLPTINKLPMCWRRCFTINYSSVKSAAPSFDDMLSVLSKADPLSTDVRFQKAAKPAKNEMINAKPKLQLWTGSNSMRSLY